MEFESREFTITDCIERMKRPQFHFGCVIVFEADDFRYEDMASVKIALPRAAWKVLIKAAKATDKTTEDMASELLCDKILEILELSRSLDTSHN